MNIKISVPMVIEPQATKYRFDGYMPLSIGEITTIVVEGDNLFIPWKLPALLRTRRVILLADASGRKWLVECR